MANMMVMRVADSRNDLMKHASRVLLAQALRLARTERQVFEVLKQVAAAHELKHEHHLRSGWLRKGVGGQVGSDAIGAHDGSFSVAMHWSGAVLILRDGRSYAGTTM